MSGPTLADLRAAKNVLAERWLRSADDAPVVATFALAQAVAGARAHVHGVGIGRKQVEGKRTSVRCVRVHVLQKLAASAVPEIDRVPDEIDGIPTDVVVSPHAFLLATACGTVSQPQRPLRPGVGLSGPRTTAGTLGCFVTDRGGDPRSFLLTCSHVLADTSSVVGEAVFQPALGDGGAAGDIIATLERFTPVLTVQEVDVDGAVAVLEANQDFDATICSLVQPQGTTAPQLMLSVVKRGRSSTPASPTQEGFISDRDLDVRVAVPGGGMISYIDQFRVEPSDPNAKFSQGGDSGSLIIEAGGTRAVGLLFAGDPGGSYSLATPIKRVLDRLQVDLV
jgi:hypothetical protein